ncbi:hypothetical protein C8Q80DRAFT_1264510 [Daedaleopsis nitida]|nr:hypothetical protein C8Q80DRAFT_1264510 [Daedaleopsis nitida]
MVEPVVSSSTSTNSGLSESPTRRLSTSSSCSKNDLAIPPSHPFRTLVLCFDGTGDQFDDDNSNVVTLFSLLKKDDRNEQLVYYQPGIGTYTVNTQKPTGLRKRIDKFLDKMIVWNLSDHVMGGYEFLMQNYLSLGFSRGAYTARALAGMIDKVGLLPACNHQQVPFAYSLYECGSREDSMMFKRMFSVNVMIDFIGVWDTVNSVGLFPRTLPFADSNHAIRVFRHALALDERRVRFQPSLYQYPTPDSKGMRTSREKKSKLGIISFISRLFGFGLSAEDLEEREQWHNQMLHEEHPQYWYPPTKVLEVWFAGCHCDVGGGSVKNWKQHTLARIPLRWMIRECFKMETGIQFDAELLKVYGINPATLYPVVKPRPAALPAIKAQESKFAERIVDGGTEEEYEARDAQAELVDQLHPRNLALHWWLLELLIRKVKGIYRPHLGAGREIPNQGRPFFVHRSVEMRMEGKKDYKVPFPYSIYLRKDDAGFEESKKFKKVFSIDVHVDFIIGVWDTVDSVGLFPHTLPFTVSNNAIRVFRHALALDERRARFRPALYRYTPSESDAKHADTLPGDKTKRGSLTSFFSRIKHALYGYTPLEDARPDTPLGDTPERGTTSESFLGRLFRFFTIRGPAQTEKPKKKKKKKKQQELERHFSEEHESMHHVHEGGRKDTDVLEVWFAGCHCDVGGGSVKNDTTESLAPIPLRWMIRECFKTNTGIRSCSGDRHRSCDPLPCRAAPPGCAQLVRDGAAAAGWVGSDGSDGSDGWDGGGPRVARRTGEVGRPTQLKAPYWWLLECIPMRLKKTFRPNLGHYRHVPTKKRTFYIRPSEREDADGNRTRGR